MALKLMSVLSGTGTNYAYHFGSGLRLGSSCWKKPSLRDCAAKMAIGESESGTSLRSQIIDSHLHVWASPQEVTHYNFTTHSIRLLKVETLPNPQILRSKLKI